MASNKQLLEMEHQLAQAIAVLYHGRCTSQQEEQTFYYLCSAIRNLPRDSKGRLFPQSNELIDTLVNKYGLITMLSLHLKRSKVKDVDPSRWSCIILVLITANSPERCVLAALNGIVLELMSLLVDSDDYEVLQPTAMAVLCHVVVDATTSTIPNSVMETVLDIFWTDTMTPYALTILDRYRPYLFRNEELRYRCIHRLEDEHASLEDGAVRDMAYRLFSTLVEYEAKLNAEYEEENKINNDENKIAHVQITTTTTTSPAIATETTTTTTTSTTLQDKPEKSTNALQGSSNVQVLICGE